MPGTNVSTPLRDTHDGARRTLPAWLLPLLLVTVTLLAYLPTLANGFIFDDDTLVTRNQWVTHPDALRGLQGIWTGEESPDYFPLTSTTFWLEYRIWGAWAPGFHLVNLLLHAGSVLLVWQIFKKLRVPGAVFAAALFAVHPVNVESVAWIAERKNTLSMVFFLASILAWLRFESESSAAARRTWYVGALLGFVAALLSKTSTVMLPFVLLLLTWWQATRAGQAGAEVLSPDTPRPPWKRVVLLTAPFFAVAFILGLLTVHFQSSQGLNPDTLARPLPLRVAQAGVNLWFYLWKTILPVDLAMVYPEARLRAATPLTFVPLVLWGILLGVLFALRRHAAAFHAFMGLAFFTLNLGPVLGILNMAWTAISVVGDHFLYIPMLGIFPLVTAFFFTTSRRLSGAQRLLGPGFAALGGGVIMSLAATSFVESHHYRSMIDLWAYNTRVRPTSGFAFYQYGLGYKLAGDPDQAAVEFKHATELSPRHIGAHFELGQYLFARRRYAEALPEFQAVLSIVPPHRDAFLFMAECVWRLGDFEKAAGLYRTSITDHPGDPIFPNAYGMMLEAQGKPEDALAQYRAAMTVDPAFPGSYFNTGNLLLEINRAEEAVAAYKAGLERDPNRADAWFNFALALRTLGKNDQANEAFQRAVQLNPAFGAGLPPR